ncbi:MAG TPA: UvrD-helicase domain-containing protein [Geminicoccaceae bacterium]
MTSQAASLLDFQADPAPDQPPHLAALNPEQRAAVVAGDGPLLVLAGAGTGKTRVLTTRLAHLLLTRRARPFNVLAVTFTNRAAREMVERVSSLLGRSVDGLWLGTFHAIGARILRRHAELVGLKHNFTILDTDDQLRLVKQVIQVHDLDPKRWAPRVLLHILQRFKDRGWTPPDVPDSEIGDFGLGKLRALYASYQERLITLNACDFGDLLLHNLVLLKTQPDLLRDYQSRFQTILVDEYQDTNVAQYLWLRLLAQGHRNLTVVGDDDQSIYSWRGAEVGNILRFEQDFPGAAVVRLERNYRSTGHILGAASGVIAHNRARLGKTLWTGDEQGERVRIASLWDDEEEARFVGEEIEALQRAGESLNEVAVLVRAGYQTRAFEERFITLGLPYRVVGGLRFYERAEIRDAIAYLRLVHSPEDDLALERIINVPKRGLGDATVQLIQRAARGAETSLVAAARMLCLTDELRGRARTSLTRLLDDLDRWRELAQGAPPRTLAETVLEESGYVRMWQDDRSPDAPGRLENLKELVRAISEFETLTGFLEHVGLVMDNASDPAGEMATVMTLHAAKGLEFGSVFLPGWEEGLFPNQRAVDEGGAKALEEERRLAYVGITRARRNLTISHAANRRIYNSWSSSVPSRFLEELPGAHTEFLQRTTVREPEMSGWFDDLRPGGRGPGYERLRAKGKPPLIEGQARVLSTGLPKSRHTIGIGQRVFHEKFGYGEVLSVEGSKLEIAFEKAGSKKVIDSFVAPV